MIRNLSVISFLSELMNTTEVLKGVLFNQEVLNEADRIIETLPIAYPKTLVSIVLFFVCVAVVITLLSSLLSVVQSAMRFVILWYCVWVLHNFLLARMHTSGLYDFTTLFQNNSQPIPQESLGLFNRLFNPQ